ncbi:hypothetical protein [Pseudoalteromonas rhizosphaerae]
MKLTHTFMKSLIATNVLAALTVSSFFSNAQESQPAEFFKLVVASS